MNDLTPERFQQLDTSDLLKETAKSLVEGIIGVAASERKDLILSIGHRCRRTRCQRVRIDRRHENRTR